jgi:hypothetical protein
MQGNQIASLPGKMTRQRVRVVDEGWRLSNLSSCQEGLEDNIEDESYVLSLIRFSRYSPADFNQHPRVH